MTYRRRCRRRHEVTSLGRRVAPPWPRRMACDDIGKMKNNTIMTGRRVAAVVDDEDSSGQLVPVIG